MEKNIAELNSWKNVKTPGDGSRLVDIGVILTRSDAKVIKRDLAPHVQAEIVKHLATRFAERSDERLAAEIIIESLLNLLSKGTDGDLITTFLTELLLHPNYYSATMRFVEMSLTMEVVVEQFSELFVTAVSINRELGLMVKEIYSTYPDKLEGGDRILAQVSTYLLSVSNANEYSVRLILVNYLGIIETPERKHGFNRIMDRFGYTILEHLFKMLFNKKTEGVALQYLLDNLPYILEGDNNCQMILHQTMRTYMLKLPERFALFIKTFSVTVRDLDDPRFDQARQVFLMHMGQLLKVASEISHTALAFEIGGAILKIDRCPYREELLKLIMADDSIKKPIKELITKLSQSQSVNEGNLAVHSPRRGRRPCFAKSNELSTIQQVAFLGGRQPIAKAS
jgi:hypothetical protein